jgi:hypothetical protein
LEEITNLVHLVKYKHMSKIGIAIPFFILFFNSCNSSDDGRILSTDTSSLVVKAILFRGDTEINTANGDLTDWTRRKFNVWELF